MSKPEAIVVVGPTAVGKSKFAVEMALECGGEIVSADSMQVYLGLNIGTAKPTLAEMQGVLHHMIDVADPSEIFSVAEYCRMARGVIDEIISRGKTPVICGGSGLYVNSLIYDMDFSGEEEEKSRGAEMTGEAVNYEEILEQEGALALFELLERRDPLVAQKEHPNNTKRVIRLLRRLDGGVEQGGIRDFSESFIPTEQFEPVIYRLTMDRPILYKKIEDRVDLFIEKGLVSEVQGLLSGGLSREAISLLGIGYKELLGFLDGEYDLDYSIYLIKRNTRRYAKRQETWFKRYTEAKIIEM
ncbi:MAG: tRNA (adenosine(37)-N6)-dimethylallyltransferase MiaA [Clostridiales Family XIII bacterium]|jgi:tRNA dimethylallyltransferase|nr:tRNA (adenosine(37)-N6)-dimethylallyltransferase MiaA [Clostridiales Family XIII bacterium]